MKSITVDQEILDLLLLNSIREQGLAPPNFKVDKNMGEGTATPLELEYRQKLLDALQRFQKASHKVFRGTDGWDEKIKKLDFLTQDYISTAQQLPMEYIPMIMEEGISRATSQLQREGINPPEIDSLDNPYLAVTLAQQQEKIESIGWQVRDKLREKVRVMQMEELYG